MPLTNPRPEAFPDNQRRVLDAFVAYVNRLAFATDVESVSDALALLESEVAAAQADATTALANAATAQSTATSAGTTATTALANAATAQTTANTGVTNAAAAQTTANTGVTNAAAAQTTANTAVTNAATAQSTATSAGTAASAAQTDATSALANAATAQTTANAVTTLLDSLSWNTVQFYTWLPSTSVSGTWLVQQNSAGFFGGWVANTSSVNGNWIEWTDGLSLPAGTYTLHVPNNAIANGGMIDVKVGSTTIATGIDAYNATTVSRITSVTGIVMPATSRATLRITVNGKNVSSTSYLCRIGPLQFERTA